MPLYLQPLTNTTPVLLVIQVARDGGVEDAFAIAHGLHIELSICLLYTSDAADE